MTGSARAILDQQISEREFMQQIIDLATLNGWRVFHDNATNARRKCPHCGEVIHQPRNVSGFPDLIMLRDGVLLAWEVKREDGRSQPTEAQRLWLREFKRVPGTPWYSATVVRPSDWNLIEQWLTAPGRGTGVR